MIEVPNSLEQYTISVTCKVLLGVARRWNQKFKLPPKMTFCLTKNLIYSQSTWNLSIVEMVCYFTCLIYWKTICLLTVSVPCFFVAFSGIGYCETVKLELSRGCWWLTEFSDPPCTISKVRTTQMRHIQMNPRGHVIFILSGISIKLNIHLEITGKKTKIFNTHLHCEKKVAF